MRHLSARRLVPAGMIAALAAAAFVAPGTASAEIGAPCSGEEIGGQGSSLQGLAQEVWTPAFNTSKDKYACPGGTPKIKAYNPDGSGAGLRSFGVEPKETKEINYSATNGYVGTDEPPNETAKKEIENNQDIEPHLANTVQTVPVIQAAVSVIARLPANCVATSTSNKGRLVLNNSTLEEIFRGTINKWSEIKDNGDKLSGTGCNAESAITRVVRFDSSGTTHIFKKYLGLINKTGEFATENFKKESVGNKTWDAISEGAENTSWPKGVTPVIRPAAKGGAEVVAKVAATESSIGYANVADSRHNTAFIPKPGGTGGPNTALFWTPIQNKSGETVTYADPASNKEVDALKESNCALTEYTNGETAFPPASVTEAWNEVTTRTSEKHYTICGLSYDLAFTKYSRYPATNVKEATTAENFLSFVVDTSKEKEGNKNNGGQTLIKNHDYEPLVGKVLTEAQSGVRGVKGKGGTEF